MDNKKWYKRSATLFWFILAILPLIVALTTTITSTFVHWSDTTSETTITSYLDNNRFTNSFISIINWFGSYAPNILKTSFRDLFINFEITSSSANILGNFFGWFTFTYFIHLMVDIIVWLPKLFHKWLERWD